MKKFYTIICLAIASLTQLQAQAPQGFNYQAQVRNSVGDLILNTNVYFKFNLMQGSQTALPIFTEIHYVPTDDLGQVNLVIGQGTATTGVFSELDWSAGSYFLGIELDTGNGYTSMGTSQLLSVPFAMYAENSGSSNGYPIGGVEGEVLTIVNGVPTWTDVSEYINSESLAEITTVEASNIDFESMTAGGNIINDGGFTIVSKGVVWSEFPDPTTELETRTDEGGGASSFTSLVIGLDDETEYFYRAYATTSLGTAYGSTYTFLTDSSQFYDQDGDGYTPEQGDCDDFDDFTHPGAAYNESTTECMTDLDGDGYGDIAGINPGTDCNDSDDFTYPGAAYNESTTECMTDLDGDGYGDIAGINPGTDCNDSDEFTNSGAEEILLDEIDNDCDGNIDFCPVQVDFITGSYILTTTATGVSGSDVFLNGAVTIEMGTEPTDRVMSVSPYPEFGAFPPIDFAFSLVCGNVVVPTGLSTGIGCVGSTTIGPAATNGTYDSNDDSSFTIVITDDEGGASCGAAYEAAFVLVKSSYVEDNDGDGYTPQQGDCDDSDEFTYPGAAQNESTTECMTDLDGDGYGDIAGINPGTDCNDSDEFTYPGAAQNESTTECMTDLDGDGYGDIAGINPGTDCNDLDDSVNQDAFDIIDGIDNNCDGIIDDCNNGYNIAGMYSMTTTYGYHDFLPTFETNTQDIEIVEIGEGVYSIADFTGGLYSEGGPYSGAYNTSATYAEITENCGLISWSGQSDTWGAMVPLEGGENSVDSNGVITISWYCEGYGENGISVYTPL